MCLNINITRKNPKKEAMWFERILSQAMTQK